MPLFVSASGVAPVSISYSPAMAVQIWDFPAPDWPPMKNQLLLLSSRYLFAVDFMSFCSGVSVWNRLKV
jgi:hypothetical protein